MCVVRHGHVSRARAAQPVVVLGLVSLVLVSFRLWLVL